MLLMRFINLLIFSYAPYESYQYYQSYASYAFHESSESHLHSDYRQENLWKERSPEQAYYDTHKRWL